ncbi:prepilin-type N-terminal cleavage/methylation domain-containing protein [Kamptonema cortianum]|nr:prepilin-type N-terminal cleavage/methylation domain-containing protein [Geitlerinema splendidum]MDK3156014.1 prepilin-type N-terminal cleavage/methylation domain-containing protein [Kamptonema cortianum]
MNGASVKRGFTLVEVLVAVFMLGVGIVALVGALSGLTRAEVAVGDKDIVNRLAHEKLNEMLATQEWKTQTGGTFDDDRYSDFSWTSEQQAMSTDGLTLVEVTVESEKRGSATVRRLVYEQSQTDPENQQRGR